MALYFPPRSHQRNTRTPVTKATTCSLWMLGTRFEDFGNLWMGFEVWVLHTKGTVLYNEVCDVVHMEGAVESTCEGCAEGSHVRCICWVMVTSAPNDHIHASNIDNPISTLIKPEQHLWLSRQPKERLPCTSDLTLSSPVSGAFAAETKKTTAFGFKGTT